MANVLVLGEHLEGKLKKNTLHALTAAQKVADGGKITALLLGKGLAPVAAELAAYGCDVLTAESDALEKSIAELWAPVVAKAATDLGVAWIVSASSSQGRDVLPRVAAKLSAAMASDVVAFGGGAIVQRPMWAGAVLADVELTTAVKLVTIRPTEFPPAAKAGAGAVAALALPALPAGRTTVLEFRQVKSERPELTEARVVVAGGRGTKGDFKPLEALADELRAALGASRAAVDAGWVPNEYQVGQTGKTVAPELYIALGISGAIQHVAGMKGSKVIVAINKDAEAPIFQIADYGLVGDLFKAGPELQAAAKAAKA